MRLIKTVNNEAALVMATNVTSDIFIFTNNKVEQVLDFASFSRQWLSFLQSYPGRPGGVKWRCHGNDPWLRSPSSFLDQFPGAAILA